MASLALAGGGAVLLNPSPALAASSTDSIYVSDYPTNVVEPLPAGTPDVVTPLTTALGQVCRTFPSYELAQLTYGEVQVCFQPFVGNETIVAGTPNVGVVTPEGYGPGCGVAIYDYPVKGGGTADVGLAPPGAFDC